MDMSTKVKISASTGNQNFFSINITDLSLTVFILYVVEYIG